MRGGRRVVAVVLLQGQRIRGSVERVAAAAVVVMAWLQLHRLMMIQAVAPRRRYAAKIESCSELVTGGGGTNFDPHFRYLVSPNALTLFPPLPSISLLGTTIGGRYCHCYMHGRGGGDCRSPLYSTHSHTIIPLPSSLSKSIQTERSRLFSRGIFHYDQTFTRVIIMYLPSLPFSPFLPDFVINTLL